MINALAHVIVTEACTIAFQRSDTASFEFWKDSQPRGQFAEAVADIAGIAAAETLRQAARLYRHRFSNAAIYYGLVVI